MTRSFRISLSTLPARARSAALGGVLALAGVLPPSAFALDPELGGTTLLEFSDARLSALGEAGTTLTGDLAAAGVNPAVLATLAGGQASAQFEIGPGDVETGYLAVGHGSRRAGWSASVVYLTAGTIDIVPTAGTPSSRDAQEDLAGALAGGLALAPWCRIGAGVKALRSNLVEEYTATATAFDGGILLDLPWKGVRLGAAAQNVGGEVTFRSTGDPLPTFYRGGLSWEIVPPASRLGVDPSLPWYVLMKNRSRFWVGGDVIRDRAGETGGAVGFEWEYLRVAALRLGGRFGQGETGFTAGVGLWIASFRLDLSTQVVDELDDRHRATLSYFWGRD